MKLGPFAACLSLALGASAMAQTTTLKIGYATTKESHYGVGSTVFCDEIEKSTQGRYKCQQFPSSALGGEREMIEAVQIGTLDLVNTSTGPVGNFVPEVKIVDIPFLFRDYDHARKVLGEDYWAYGAHENKHALETLARYSFQQGLSVRQVALDEMFAKPTYELSKI